ALQATPSSVVSQASSSPVAARQDVASVAPERAFFNQYCIACHSDRLHTAGLTLETIDLNNIGSSGEVLEAVVRKLRAGAMPPPGLPRPAAGRINEFITTLEGKL